MSPGTTSSAYEGLLAVVNPDTGGLLIKERVRSAADALDIYTSLREADQLSAVNRLQYQATLDGVPPYNSKIALNRGLADTANVNFGFMEDILSAAEAPFHDLIEQETLFTTPTKYGTDSQQREEWSQIIAEEFTQLITQTPGFEYDYPEMIRQFKLHGVCVPYFPDTIGIQWETAAIGDFLIPRHTRAKSTALEVACAVRDFLPSELYQYIKDPELAESQGWNVGETKAQLKQAREHNWNYLNPEQWEEDWKNNDLTMNARSKVIRAVHMWVTGVGGDVSHYIFAEDGTGKDFMYKKVGRFASQSEAYTMMTDGVGTNGFYHGIRGIGYKTFELVKQLNMMWSSLIDAIRMSSKLVIQPTSEAALQELALVHFGNYVVMPPNTQTVNWNFPNLQNTIIPGLQMITQTLQNKAGRYTSEAEINSAKEQTRAEIMAKVDQVAKLSISQLNIFYKGWTRLGREQARRVKRKDWTEQDRNGPEVLRFYAACKARGVPAEAIHAIDLTGVYAVKAVGNGSAAARTSIYQRLLEVYPQWDEEGKQNFIRDYTVNIAGVTAANRYAPKVPGRRPPQDAKMAMLENKDMDAGEYIVVLPNELHAVHIPIHLEDMQRLIMGYQAYLVGDPAGIPEEEAIPALVLLQGHTGEEMDAAGQPGHLAYVQSHPQAPLWRQALQQTNEVVVNGQRSLEKKQRDMAEAEARGEEYQGQPNQLGVGEDIQIKQATEAIKNALAEQKLVLGEQQIAANQQRLQQEQERHQQSMVLNDVKTASAVRKTRRTA